jgi:hypothetical protein
LASALRNRGLTPPMPSRAKALAGSRQPGSPARRPDAWRLRCPFFGFKPPSSDGKRL